jgi:hypothetical protein
MNPVIVPSLAPFPIAVPAIGIVSREKPQRTMFSNRKKVKPMFGKRKLELLAHTARIKELEEILCPCEQHDWISNGYHFSGGTGRGDETTIYHYICKRCKKRMQSIQPYLGSDSDGR